MTDGNILNLVKHLVFELDRSGRVHPINQRATLLLQQLSDSQEQAPLQALFSLDDVDDAFALAQSGEPHESQLQLSSGPHLHLKWEFTQRQEGQASGDAQESDAQRLLCFAVEWEPFQELVEKIQRTNLLFKELLLNVLPHHVAESLIANKAIRPKAYRGCSILFTDVVSFSRLTFHLDPVSLIRKLNEYYTLYDGLMDEYGIEKIKTIGDAYMCVAGLPNKKDSHAVDCAMVALGMLERTKGNQSPPKMIEDEGLDLNNWQIRVGIHSGPCISGVVGQQKYVFDIWGDSVNIAARMESASEPSQINISRDTYEEIKPFFDCSLRGSQYVKNIGEIEMYFIEGIKPSLSIDGLGQRPNDDFAALYCDVFRVCPSSRQFPHLPKFIQTHASASP